MSYTDGVETTPALGAISMTLAPEIIREHWDACVSPILRKEKEVIFKSAWAVLAFTIPQSYLPNDSFSIFEIELREHENKWYTDYYSPTLSSITDGVVISKTQCLQATFNQYYQLAVSYQNEQTEKCFRRPYPAYEELIQHWRTNYQGLIRHCERRLNGYWLKVGA